jgi:hypothetical protein
MQRMYVSPRHRELSVFCLTAIAAVVDRLPALYRVVESGKDDVRIELNMKASAWEVLRLTTAGGDKVACSLSRHLESPSAAPFPEWLARAIEAMEADLHWASFRTCTDQADEMLAALVTFRGSMLRGAVY